MIDLDLKGIIIVTGANGGLGSATVSQIVTTPQLNQSYHGIYTIRNPASAKTLDAAIASSSSPSHSHEKLALDLSSLDNIRKVAADINSRVAAGAIRRIYRSTHLSSMQAMKSLESRLGQRMVLI
jgi:NAD(P)-dependent dehydrogenase (short-subunit alcohol dehydrogenase family)